MNPIIFQKQEAAYLNWIKAHPGGFVLNTRSKLSPDYMMLHRASCKLVTGYLGKAKAGGFTERGYRKVCADSLEPIQYWVKSGGGSLSTCAHCSPEVRPALVRSDVSDGPKYAFEVDRHYERKEVIEMVGVTPIPTGGDWFTGYTTHAGVSFIFANIGSAGRTGHDYGNYWDGDELEWSGKTGSRATWDSIKALVEPGAEVHLFYRNADREPWTYAGLATPVFVDEEAVPVRIRWRFTEPVSGDSTPIENSQHTEGAKKSRYVTTYERSGKARSDCLKHYGARCCICQLDFSEKYGVIGAGFMHVHHLKPVADGNGKEVKVDAVQDLRPVCPNCHAMLHRTKPPLSIEKLLSLLVV